MRVPDAVLSAVHPGEPEVPPGAGFRRGDLRDAPVVAAALDGVDAGCHQAALVGLGLDLAPDDVGCSDLGTAVLLAAMGRPGVRRLVLPPASPSSPRPLRS